MTKREPEAFAGFDIPESNWFKLPNVWTDVTSEITNIAELKVIEYVLRHTWGFHEYGLKKRISVDEFTAGRKYGPEEAKRHDKDRMDKGTGLSRRGVQYGLEKAVIHGYLEVEVDDSDRARVAKYYCVRMKKAPDMGVQDVHPGVQNVQTGAQTVHPEAQDVRRGGANSTPRTKKDTLERNLKKDTSENDLTPIWLKVLKALEDGVPRSNYVSWFADTQLAELTDTTATVAVPSAQARDWLACRAESLIVRTLRVVLGREVTLQLVIRH